MKIFRIEIPSYAQRGAIVFESDANDFARAGGYCAHP
jgi:hypothetical protein